MKVHHVAHYEYGSRPHSEMREKEFPTRWEAEKFCEEWRRDHWYFGGAWCPDAIEEWVNRIEHDKNNDVDYVIDTYMFGVIENDRERKSSDFHVSFYYRG